MNSFATRALAARPEAMAPDGSEVRLLVASPRGSMAHFTLRPRQVSVAVVHRTVEEIWFFLRGSGRLWRSFGGAEEVVAVTAGVSLAIPVGTRFQFRNDGEEPLEAVAVTMPPWPGAEEAVRVEGAWSPSA